MRKLLIGLIALAVLLVAADRISVAVAENQISDRLISAYGLPHKPGVTITGFPFLTQATITRLTSQPARFRPAVPRCTT
jgi:Flp pilus assembly protein protease CpaA